MACFFACKKVAKNIFCHHWPLALCMIVNQHRRANAPEGLNRPLGRWRKPVGGRIYRIFQQSKAWFFVFLNSIIVDFLNIFLMIFLNFFQKNFQKKYVRVVFFVIGLRWKPLQLKCKTLQVDYIVVITCYRFFKQR